VAESQARSCAVVDWTRLRLFGSTAASASLTATMTCARLLRPVTLSSSLIMTSTMITMMMMMMTCSETAESNDIDTRSRHHRTQVNSAYKHCGPKTLFVALSYARARHRHRQRVCPSDRPSVRLSHARNVSKLMTVG